MVFAHTAYQMDRIDPLYYARSSRIDLKDETRIKATSEEASEWAEQQRTINCWSFMHAAQPKLIDHVHVAPPPNFISDIFYLTIAMSHYGYLRTIQTFNDLAKHLEDIQRHLDFINGDGSWMGVRLTILFISCCDPINSYQGPNASSHRSGYQSA